MISGMNDTWSDHYCNACSLGTAAIATFRGDQFDCGPGPRGSQSVQGLHFQFTQGYYARFCVLITALSSLSRALIRSTFQWRFFIVGAGPSSRVRRLLPDGCVHLGGRLYRIAVVAFPCCPRPLSLPCLLGITVSSFKLSWEAHVCPDRHLVLATSSSSYLLRLLLLPHVWKTCCHILFGCPCLLRKVCTRRSKFGRVSGPFSLRLYLPRLFFA